MVLKSLKTPTLKKSVAVVGSGSWATALVKIFTDAHVHVHWYVHDETQAEYIQKHLRNPNYLSEVRFKPSRITVSTDINEVVHSSKWVVLAVPSAFLGATLQQLTVSLKDKIIVSGVKGIVPESKCIVGTYLNKQFDVQLDQFMVISGPSHAEEVALERLSYLTLAYTKSANAVQLQSLLKVNYIKSIVSEDVIGIEYAALLKNIFALAVGIAHGLNYGDNFQSVLISNSVREMNRFLNKVSEFERDVSNSVYLGDLLVTAYSLFSRNRRFGNMIGRGYTVKGAQLEMNMIAEGYYASSPVYEQAKQLHIKTPIIDTVYHILYQQKNPKKSFKKLAKLLD